MFGLSAIEFFLVIVAGFSVVYWILPKKASWISFLLLVLALSFLAFNVEPNETDDVTRYFKQIVYLKNYGYDYLSRCFDEGINSWDVYRVCGYYFYFISKLPDVHYLPAVTIFIVYFLNLLIIYRLSVKFEVNKLYTYFGTMFFISTYWYYDTYSGIRNGLVFAVIIACAYYQFVEKKNIPLCIAGYVLACLTHSAGIIIVLMIIVAAVTLNNSGKFMNFLLIFGVAGGTALFEYLSTKTDNSFVQSIAGKVERNASGGSLDFSTNYVINIVVWVVVALLLYYYSQYILNEEYGDNLKMFYKFSSIVIFFMLGSVYTGLVFLRLARWILPLIGAFAFMIGAQQQSQYVAALPMGYVYNAPTNERIKIRLQYFVIALYVVFICVHFGYLLKGSSLCWMHF